MTFETENSKEQEEYEYFINYQIVKSNFCRKSFLWWFRMCNLICKSILKHCYFMVIVLGSRQKNRDFLNGSAIKLEEGRGGGGL